VRPRVLFYFNTNGDQSTQMTTATGTQAPKHTFFSFPNPINESVARSVAAGVVIMSAATIAFDFPPIMFLIAYGFIARVAAGPRLSPLAQVVQKIVIPVLKLPYKPIAGPPKRFAAAIGVTFSLTAIILHYGFGLTGVSYGVLGALIFAAGLEAVFGYCLGCKVFSILMKVGLIPESVCLDCANFGAKMERMSEQGLLPNGNPCAPADGSPSVTS
jgi:hypothetical protein